MEYATPTKTSYARRPGTKVSVLRGRCKEVAVQGAGGRPDNQIVLESDSGELQVVWQERLVGAELMAGDRLVVSATAQEDGSYRAMRILNLDQGTLLRAPSPKAWMLGAAVATAFLVTAAFFWLVGGF